MNSNFFQKSKEAEEACFHQQEETDEEEDDNDENGDEFNQQHSFQRRRMQDENNIVFDPEFAAFADRSSNSNSGSSFREQDEESYRRIMNLMLAHQHQSHIQIHDQQLQQQLSSRMRSLIGGGLNFDQQEVRLIEQEMLQQQQQNQQHQQQKFSHGESNAQGQSTFQRSPQNQQPEYTLAFPHEEYGMQSKNASNPTSSFATDASAGSTTTHDRDRLPFLHSFDYGTDNFDQLTQGEKSQSDNNHTHYSDAAIGIANLAAAVAPHYQQDSVRSLVSLPDSTGHSHGSITHSYSRKAPSSNSLNVVSHHSSSSDNNATIGHGNASHFHHTNRRQSTAFQPQQQHHHQQQQQAGLFFAAKVSDHDQAKVPLEGSFHSTTSFHSDINQHQHDISQSERGVGTSSSKSSDSWHHRRRSMPLASYNTPHRYGPRNMLQHQSSSHSDHSNSSLLNSSFNDQSPVAFHESQQHSIDNQIYERDVSSTASQFRSMMQIPQWNQDSRSRGFRDLLSQSEQAAHDNDNSLQRHSWQQPHSQSLDAVNFRQPYHHQQQFDNSSSTTVLPTAHRYSSISNNISETNEIISIFSSKPSTNDPIDDNDVPHRKRGRTKSNQNIGEMRRVPFRSPTIVGQHSNEKDDTKGSDADHIEFNSLLHNSCKLYPEARVVIESALHLDEDAIRRSVPVKCVSTATARRNSLGYVAPDLVTCIQLMKHVTIDDSRDGEDATVNTKQQGVCYSLPINIALIAGAHLDVIELLATAGPDVLTRLDGPDQANSLGIAVAHGCDIDVIRMLLTINPDTAKGCDRHRNLPLHIAVRSSSASTEILIAIYESYPDAIGIKNFHSHTPLDVAIHSPLCSDGTVDLLQGMFYSSLEFRR